MRDVDGLVSITIPFYNCERFLSEAIESVLSQTYEKWELFLVDDGSSDGGTKIARSYEARFPNKIYYLEHAGHRNRGVNCSRNIGAKMSRGELLAFLDSDDVWLPEKLERQVTLMEAHLEAGLVYGPSEWWYSWDAAAKEDERDFVPPVAPGPQLYSPPFLLTHNYPLGAFGAPCPSSFLLRRTAFDRVNGFDECFNPGTFQVFEDIAFLSKICLHVPVFVGDRPWDKYRCKPLSLWRAEDGTSRGEEARRYYFDWLAAYLEGQGVKDPQIRRALRRQAWAYRFPLPAGMARILRRIGDKLLPSIETSA